MAYKSILAGKLFFKVFLGYHQSLRAVKSKALNIIQQRGILKLQAKKKRKQEKLPNLLVKASLLHMLSISNKLRLQLNRQN